MLKAIQNSFTGGEQSPAMYGRIDDQTGYQAGLAKCRNFIVLPQGPVQNRAGFEFVRRAKFADKPSVLIPFTYNTDQTMVIELGDKYARFHTQGATLLGSNGEPYEVATPYAAEDVAEIHYTQSADVVTLVHPSYAPMELQRYGAADWRLRQIDFGAPLPAPTGLTGSYTCTAKTDVVTAEMRSMYTIKYVVTAVRSTSVGSVVDESAQSNAVAITGNLFVDASKITLQWTPVSGAERYRVYKTYSGRYGFIGETAETSFTDTNVDPDESITPPRYIDPFHQSKGISAVNVTSGGSGYLSRDRALARTAVSVTFVRSREGGYEDPAIKLSLIDKAGAGSGGSLRYESSGYVRSSEVRRFGNGESEYYAMYYTSQITVTAIVPSDPGRGYISPVATLATTTVGAFISGDKKMARSREVALGTESVAPSVSVSDSTGYGASLLPVVDSSGRIVQIRIVSAGQNYTSPTITIAGTKYGGSGAAATAVVGQAGDYPGAVTYYQQRRVFAGSYNHPQYVWMTRPGTEADMHNSLPAQDDDCIAVRASVAETSRIRHVVPLTSLMLLTASSEIRTTTANDDAITPTSIGFLPQTYYGAAAPQPLLVGRAAVYASQRGGHIRSLGYSYQKGGFDTDDLSIRAAHLFENTDIVSMALSKTPNPIVWCVTSDGDLLGCTYLADQNVTAWHKHTTKDGAFESVTAVAEGDEDIVYAVVRRLVNGQTVRYIERMHERQFDTLENCFYVDAGAEYRGSYTKKLSGLDHLEGKTVSVLADGKVLPDAVVKDGQITITEEARHIIVGLPIDAEIKTLPVVMQDRTGGAGRGAMKNICNVFVRVYQASGILAGPDEDSLREYSPREREPYGSPPNVISREVGVLVPPAWTDGGQIVIRQKYPLPLTVCSLAGEVAT